MLAVVAGKWNERKTHNLKLLMEKMRNNNVPHWVVPEGAYRQMDESYSFLVALDRLPLFEDRRLDDCLPLFVIDRFLPLVLRECFVFTFFRYPIVVLLEPSVFGYSCCFRTGPFHLEPSWGKFKLEVFILLDLGLELPSELALTLFGNLSPLSFQQKHLQT